MNRTYEEEKQMLKFIGETYRLAKRRTALMEGENCVAENRKIYDNDRNLLSRIDRCLLDCSKETQLIIRREYLEMKDPGWWQDRYAKSTFYRQKKSSVQEFMHCLDF